MGKKRGRPQKPPEERQATVLQIGLTAEESALIEQAASAKAVKPVAWARDVLVKTAKRTR